MPDYVAFLRAINVGGRTVKMDRLRALFEGVGLTGVSTFIASGNVIFHAPDTDAAALEGRIEAHLKSALGYDVETFLRTPAELTAVAAVRPFAVEEMETAGHTVHVLFLRRALDDAAVAAFATQETAVDAFRAHGREVYWLCRVKLNDSLVKAPRLATALGMPSTARNVTTVRKLAARF